MNQKLTDEEIAELKKKFRELSEQIDQEKIEREVCEELRQNRPKGIRKSRTMVIRL